MPTSENLFDIAYCRGLELDQATVVSSTVLRYSELVQ